MKTSISTYQENGTRAADARAERDFTRSQVYFDWLRKALAMETAENKAEARAAFENAYRESNRRTVQYFN